MIISFIGGCCRPLRDVEYGLGFCPACTDRDGPSSDEEDDLPEEIEVEVEIDEDEPGRCSIGSMALMTTSECLTHGWART